MSEIYDKSRISFITLWKLNDWGMYNRRDEAILWELSRRDNVKAVLHVEHLSLRGLIYKLFEWLKEKNKNLKKVYLYHVIKGLSLKPISPDNNKKYYIYSVVIMYSGKNPLLKKISNLLVRIQYQIINNFFPRSSNVIVIAYPPSEYLIDAINNIRHDLLIADFEDDTAERYTDINKKNQILENYRKILPKCKWIFSTSPGINQKYKEYAGKEISYLPNGVDLQTFFISPDKKFLNLQKKGKVIGYIGIINKEIDIDLLKYIVACHPKANFVLVGSATEELLKEIERLRRKYSNFHYDGKCCYKDIPYYISYFDVLINIKKNDYTTAGGESQKIYEYLLTGKPIVSTPVPPANWFSDLIYTATNKFHFSECLKIALEENNKELAKKRINVALENSWAKRVDFILENIYQLLR